MPAEMRLSVRDYAKKLGKTTLRFATVTAANHDAVNTGMTAVRNAIDAVVVGVIAREDRVMAANEISAANPTDKDAQRGAKWLVSYADLNNPLGSGSFEIPCPDSTFKATNSNDMDLESTEGAALVEALEDNLVSRLGNPIQVTKVTFVTRSIS